MQAAASGLPGAEVIHIPTDAPTSAPPVKDEELDALSSDDEEFNPDVDESAELFQALETELSLLSDPPAEIEAVAEDGQAFDDFEDGSQEDLPTMDLPDDQQDQDQVSDSLSLPKDLFDDEDAFDQKLAEIDRANQTQLLPGGESSENLLDNEDSIDDLMKDLGIEEGKDLPAQESQQVFEETMFMSEQTADKAMNSDILDTPLPFEPDAPKEELNDLSEILNLEDPSELNEEPSFVSAEDNNSEELFESADAVLEESAEVISEEAAEVISEEAVEAVSEEAAEAVSEEAAEAVSEEAAEAVSEEVAEAVSEEVAEAASEEAAEAVSEEAAEAVFRRSSRSGFRRNS